MTDQTPVEVVEPADATTDPIEIMWLGIPGLRCPICTQDFLDDGSINVRRSYDDHIRNRHAITVNRLDTNAVLDRPASETPTPVAVTLPESPAEPEPTLVEPAEDAEPQPQIAGPDDWKKWYIERRERAERDGVEIPDVFVGETEAEYTERTTVPEEDVTDATD